MILVGGYVNDFFERKRLLIISSSISIAIYAVASIWLVFLPITWTFLLITSLCSTCWYSIFSQSSNIYLRNLVDKEKLPKALSVNQMRDGAVELTSAPLASFLLSFGTIIPFIANWILSTTGLFATLFVPEQKSHLTDKAPAETDKNPNGTLKNILTNAFGGLKLILTNTVLRTSTLISSFYFTLLNGFFLLIMLDTVGTGAGMITAATYNSAIAGGVILGSILSTKIVDIIPTGKLITAPCVSLFVGYGLENYGSFRTGVVLLTGMTIIAFVPLLSSLKSIPVPAKWESYLESK